MDSNEQRDAIVKAMIANTANSVAQEPGYQRERLKSANSSENPATIGQKSGDATPPRYSLDPGSGSNFPERRSSTGVYGLGGSRARRVVGKFQEL